MTRPMYRNHTLRRVTRKTPGAELVKHFEKRKPSAACCGTCGALLQAVPRARPYEMENMPKSQKRPERAFGGVLCSSCSRREIIKRARA